MKKPLLTRKACLIILITCVVLIAAFRVFFADTLAESALMRSLISDDDYRPAILNTLVMDALGSVVFVCMTIYMGYRVWGIKKPWMRSLLFGLPALAVAVNNAPIIGLATGNAYITDPAGGVLIMLAYCLAIGTFEEFAFRGLFFMMILEDRRKSTKQIFWTTAISSAVFGLVHLVNLAVGAGPGATLLQVGYSFLIGGMCAIVLLKTGSIWYCVLLHTVYDIGGTILYVGGGVRWDAVTVTITAVLGVAVAVFMTVALMRIKPEDIAFLFPEKQKKQEDPTQTE
ncbi:MAG: CPBP family intramembrane metalloprotease [Clostridia bacterium]|nr:CPBP family intramembrane metalloprotease [Clostridia bacterium]